MYKVLWLLKRKQGISHEEFREHFEREHAPLALKYIGHLFVEYRRNYIDQAMGRLGVDDRGESLYGAMDWNWDCISEWILRDEAAFGAIQAIMTGDVIKQFHALEEKFMDREAQVMLRCAVADTGTGQA